MYKTASRKLQLGREIRSRKHVSSVPALAAMSLKGGGASSRALVGMKQVASPTPAPLRKKKTPKPAKRPSIDPVRLYFYGRLKNRTSVEGSLGRDEQPPDWLVAEIRRGGLSNWLARTGRRVAASARRGTLPRVSKPRR